MKLARILAVYFLVVSLCLCGCADSASAEETPIVPATESAQPAEETEAPEPVQPAIIDRETDTNSYGERLVWIPTKGGIKYHKTAECSDMIDPVQVTQAQAVQLGFDPCKKCYK